MNGPPRPLISISPMNMLKRAIRAATRSCRARDGLFVGPCLMGLCAATPLAGQIAGTAHDFSEEDWSSGFICEVCHTPHNADTDVVDSPLWDHEVTELGFTLYTSATQIEIPVQPRGNSLLCLSCHDGQVAVDSYGGATGSEYITGPALLSRDLSDDHPVSVYWDHQTGIGTCIDCHFVHSPELDNQEVPFFEHYVECASCHDVHGSTGIPMLLRKTMNGSELCLHCHHK